MTDEDEEDYRNNNICRFFEKNIESDKVRDLGLLTGKYRGPVHGICIINVTQDKSNNVPFIFHKVSIYDCHIIFKQVVVEKNDKVKFDIIPETNEE